MMERIRYWLNRFSIVASKEALVKEVKTMLLSGEEIIIVVWGSPRSVMMMHCGIIMVTNNRIIRYSRSPFRTNLITAPFHDISFISEDYSLRTVRIIIQFYDKVISFFPSADERSSGNYQQFIIAVRGRIAELAMIARNMMIQNNHDVPIGEPDSLARRKDQLFTDNRHGSDEQHNYSEHNQDSQNHNNKRAAEPMEERIPVDQIPEQIHKLAHLASAGMISQEEFEHKKQELLARM